jgi:hypothetical protein
MTDHRTECIRRLADIELLMVALSLPRSHIIDDGITPDMAHCICLGDSEACFSDNDANLAFEVDGLGEACVREDGLPAGDYASGALGEDYGVRGLVDFVGGVKAGLVEFCDLC